MACKLTKSDKPRVDFEGTAGEQVKLGIDSDSGGAIIVAAIYAGKQISDPWKFTLVSGNKLLTILVDNPVPRDWTTIQEICNGKKKTLLHYPFDPDGPTQSFRIEAQ